MNMYKIKSMGYTQQLTIETDTDCLSVLVKPSTDYDSSFKAVCLDTHEFIIINGWAVNIIEV